MTRRVLLSISCLFLLYAVARGSEAESSRQNRVVGRNEQVATLRVEQMPGSPPSNRSVTSDETGAPSAPMDGREESSQETVDPRASDEVQTEQQQQQQENEEEEEEEEYEGEEEEPEDEYVEELKAVAESHEAMSKDDGRNANVTAATEEPAGAGRSSKSFESREVITVNESDEDVASNEAITDEVFEKNDEEVEELLKYKKEKNSNVHAEDRTKTKRVPTVKKELSTQKEILVTGNEKLPKSLVSPEDTPNRLYDESETGVTDRTMEKSHVERRSGEIDHNNRRKDETMRRLWSNRADRMDKWKNVLTDFDYFGNLILEYLGGHMWLKEIGADEDAVAANLEEFKAKLQENPRNWARMQRYFANVQSCRDSRKANGTSTFPFTPFPGTEETKKSRKKPKKKKKPEHRKTTTTSTTTSTTTTPLPETPAVLTTTEAPWQTTPVQWRLVAERLFGPPWKQDLQEDPEKTAKIHYTVASKPRSLPSIRDLIDQNKSKGTVKNFGAEKSNLLSESPREMSGQSRLLRFGKINTHQPSHLQNHREFNGMYDRPSDSEHIPDYDVPEAYQRMRYNQLSPSSRDYLRRHEDDYQEDFVPQPDSFAHNQEYRPSGRDFAVGKSWPDVSYKYNRPWKTEERPVLPVSSSKWPWRQPPNDLKYWPQRGGFLQNDRSYWNPVTNEEDIEDESESQKVWQQQQQQQQQQEQQQQSKIPVRSWERDRSNGWQVEKGQKVSSWQQNERNSKLYEQSSLPEKNKNRSESSKGVSKQETKEKALPQITMKTWNSLTSDPATWPYKLPGAKPWPKDENGNSYNPNADLVKKLGLDKQNNAGWSKADSEKSYGTDANLDRKTKERQNGSMSYESKEEEFSRHDGEKYRYNKGSNNPNDFKSRSQVNEGMKSSSWSSMLSDAKKEWSKPREAENVQNDQANWSRKFDNTKNSWSTKASLPKIQSVGAWVMPADQSTWKPYQLKPMEPSDENSSSPRRWSTVRSSSLDNKWPRKETGLSRSWSDKIPDENSWMEESGWPQKSPKTWYQKPKDTEVDLWRSKTKSDTGWMSKPNDSSWPTKLVDNNSWATKSSNQASWKTGDTWPRKSNDQTTSWTSKTNELNSWQQKINDEWNYGKSSGTTGSWPSKWKQFAYHRVTAMPISKPGTTADASSSSSSSSASSSSSSSSSSLSSSSSSSSSSSNSPSKPKNAFVAVSAVSSPKYGPEWRKNEEEPRNEAQVENEGRLYAWKKDVRMSGASRKSNGTDLLEDQLEALRQIDFWPYKGNETEKQPWYAPMQTTSSTPGTNSTSVETHRGDGTTGKDNGKLPETHQEAISMK